MHDRTLPLPPKLQALCLPVHLQEIKSFSWREDFVLSEKGESVIQNTLLLLDYLLRNVKIVISVGLCFLFNFNFKVLSRIVDL